MADVDDESFLDDKAQSESKKSFNYADADYGEIYNDIFEDSIESEPIYIEEESPKKIEQELRPIRLIWPEVDHTESQFLLSYRTVSDKEKLLLVHAENFRKHYHATYTDRKPLMLVCDNEFGVQKFVSTSIRPSTPPYPELYTWQGCANFVSDHLEYEPPERPLSLPLILRSPTWMMEAQRGNNFEYATFLTSLLLGKGYNAFVVSGYASREQVACDMSMRACPYIQEPEAPETPPETIDTSRYKMKSPPDFRSHLLMELEVKAARKMQAESQQREEERLKMLVEQERPHPDEFWGQRIHSWVLILPEVGGPREEEIKKPIFIEPTSSLSYSPEERETKLLYHGIESIWNDKNYWVNMQVCEEGCSQIDWDLRNTNNWQNLLPHESLIFNETEEDEENDDNFIEQHDKHLDMPFSYVENIDIQSLDFERRYPNGTKTLYFKKTRVDFYAPYVQMDGLVRKITFYEDYEYNLPIQVWETYLNRADMLLESKKYLDTFIAVDYYKRGRSDACKEHSYSTNGNDRIDESRTLHFYDIVRIDGLSKIEVNPNYFIQHFIGRKDFLYYRSAEYSTDDENVGRGRTISRIIEKYNRNESVPGSNDIAIRDFNIKKNEIRLDYHYEKNRVTRAMKKFVKPPMTEKGEHPIFNIDLIQGYNPDPMAIPEKQLSLYYELEQQLKDEGECLTLLRDAESEVLEFLRKRSSEYIMPKLIVSVFDRNRNEEAKAEMLAKEKILKAQSKKEVEVDVDYLGPYLARLGNPSHLTKAQAIQIRQDCLNDLKKLLADRANHISQQFDECTKELDQAQNWLTQSESKTREDEDELVNLTNDINFHSHILDVRLQRHCELAPERYRKMMKKLNGDIRLLSLHE